MTNGGITKALTQIGVHAACGLLERAGVIIGPLLAGAASWGGKYWLEARRCVLWRMHWDRHWLVFYRTSLPQPRKGRLPRSRRSATAIWNGPARRLSSRDCDLGARRLEPSPYSRRDLDLWFEAWDRRLTRGLQEDPEALFRRADSPEPVDWVQADKDTWWAAFEPAPLRWAAEEQFEEACAEEAALPAALRGLLRDELQGWVVAAFHHVLRNEGQRRAWIGYQQRYFQHLAQQAAQGNTAIAQLAAACGGTARVPSGSRAGDPKLGVATCAQGHGGAHAPRDRTTVRLPARRADAGPGRATAAMARLGDGAGGRGIRARHGGPRRRRQDAIRRGTAVGSGAPGARLVAWWGFFPPVPSRMPRAHCGAVPTWW